jgi:hypothetical protein
MMEGPRNTPSRSIGPALLLTGLSLVAGPCVHAQTTESQFWSDFTLGRNFASIYMAEVEVGYQTLLEGTPQWSTLSIAPTLEASFTPHIDVISGFPWMDTQQDDEVRTREFRTQLGARYHVLPFKKVQPRLTFRWEERFFNTLEPEPATSQSSRIRLNLAFWVAIDKPLMSYDTLWYAFTDLELFWVADEQLQERYANQSIGRIGFGRKFSYNWRMELVYSLARFSNEIDTERADQDLDHIFRMTFKYYITPPNRRVPKPTEGGG